MHYDVFISYSTSDRLIAETILDALRRRGITCWIAPDSIAAGAAWREAIVDGLEQSRVMLVVLSEKSIKSWHVSNELGLAVDSGLTIVPLRVADVQLPKSMRYSLAGFQWVDAFPDVAKHLDTLSRDIELMLAKLATPAPEVTLKTPLAGAVFQPGSLQSIRWKAVVAGDREVANVSVELRRDGHEVLRIADVATGLALTSEEYRWQVPSDLEPANSYIVQVTVVDDAGRVGSAQAAVQVVSAAAAEASRQSTPQPSTKPPIATSPAQATQPRPEREAGEIALRDRLLLFATMVLGYPIMGFAIGGAGHELGMLTFGTRMTQTIGLQFPAAVPERPPTGLIPFVVALLERIFTQPGDAAMAVGRGLANGALFGLAVGLAMTALAVLAVLVVCAVRRCPWQLAFEEWDESIGMVAMGMSMVAMIGTLFVGYDGQYWSLVVGLIVGVAIAFAHRRELNQRRQAKLLGR